MRGSAAKIRKEFAGIGPFDVRIQAEVDDKAIKGLRAALKNIPDVVVTADTSAADRDLAKLRQRITTLSDHEIGVTISAADAHREVDDIRTELHRLSDAKVDVDVDTGAALAQLGAVSAQLGRVNGRTARVTVDADTGGAMAKIVAFQAQVDRIRNIRAALVYDVRIGPALIQLALLQTALLGIPAAVGGSVYAVASLGAALAPTVGALALLPAVIGAAGIAFAGLKVGMTGFGEAMKNLDDPEKFAEAIAKLSPAAREAATTIRGLAPAWTELQQAVQQELFAGVAARIRELAGVYLPMLREGLSGTAGAFNQFTANFTAFAMTPQTLADIPVIFDNTNLALSNLAPAVNNVLGAFRDMAVVGSGFLPGLATGIVNATQRFQTFIHTARESGQLAVWIQGGLDALRELWTLVTNLGSIFGGLFRAANTAGADFLGTLNTLTGTVAGFLNSAEGQSALVTLFRNIQGMTEAMRPGLEAILGMIGDLITGLGPMLPQVGAAFSAVAEALRPLLGLLIDLVSVLLPPLLDMITRFPGVFIGVAIAVGVLVGAYRALIAVSGVIKAAQASLAVIKASTVLPTIWAMVTALWAQAAAFVAAYWPILLIIGIIAVLVGAVIYAWNNFEWFRNAVLTVWNAIKIAFDAIGAAAVWLWQTIFVPAFNAIGAAAMWLWTNAIKPAFDFIVMIFSYVAAIVFTILVAPLLIAWNLISAAALWLWENGIRPAFQAIGSFIGWVWTALIQPALAALVGFWQNVIQPAAVWLWQSVIVPVFQAIGAFIGWVWTGLIKPALDALVWFWQSVLMPAAMWLWQSVIVPVFQGIGSFIAWVWTSLIKPALDALVWLWQNVLAPAAMWLWNSVIKPAWEGIGNIIRWVWENVIQPAFNAVKDGLQWVGEKFDQVTNWIGDIWNKIRGFLAKPINFMIGTVWNEGIVPAWNWVAELLGIGLVQPLPLIPEYASGGAVRGPGTTTSDSIPARLSRDEHVWSAAEVRGAGGHDAVADLRAHARGSGPARQGPRRLYADGGPAYGFADGGAWRGMWDAVRAAFPSARLTSAYRPGDPGHHGTGNAVDLAGPRSMDMPAMLAINQWVAGRAGGGTELIHTQPGAINLDNGAPHTFDAGTRAGHRDHVHWAEAAGGVGGGGGFNYAQWLLDTFGRPLFFGATDPLIDALRGFTGAPPPRWRETPPGFVTKVRDDVWAWVERKVREAFPGGGGGMDVSGITGPVVDQVRQVAARFGWDQGAEWDAIMQLVNKESSWNPAAANPTSSARGLFQKMTSYHGPVEPTPAGQAAWGLDYIRGRYGTPTAAWAFHRANNHYDSGGIARGAGIMFKDVIADERVLSPEQTGDYDVLSDYRRMIEDGRLVPARGLDARQLAAMTAGQGPAGREMHLHVHGDVNDPMDVDSLYNQLDFRERSASL